MTSEAPESPETPVVEIDLNDLDWQALEDIEEIVGRPIGAELSNGTPSVRTIRALVLWKLRQENPRLTLETMPSVKDVQITTRAIPGAAERPLGRARTGESRSPRRHPRAR